MVQAGTGELWSSLLSSPLLSLSLSLSLSLRPVHVAPSVHSERTSFFPFFVTFKVNKVLLLVSCHSVSVCVCVCVCVALLCGNGILWMDTYWSGAFGLSNLSSTGLVTSDRLLKLLVRSSERITAVLWIHYIDFIIIIIIGLGFFSNNNVTTK